MIYNINAYILYTRYIYDKVICAYILNIYAYILDTYMIRFPTNDCFEDLLLGDSATLLYHSEYTALNVQNFDLLTVAM